ncbi:restriction endonuclease subunit S [Leyella stercorea]|uniref:restriction endonuclease subunit S n=1 Tax=Leyella stercorea TaxID=363265 RepID=UPI003AB83BEE
MKQGWEYEKIGNICNITTGKLDANAANEDGLYPFFTCSRIPLSINTYAYDCECILIAGNGDLNVKYYNGKFNAYQRTYILQLKNDVNGVEMRYIFAFFNLYIEELRRKSIGGIIKYIKLGDLTNALLPLPDITTQLSIVSELDKINELIRLKKEQLKDYNNLAQSIFYEMFGDPVENEKGWEVKKIGEIGSVERGAGISKKDFAEDGLPCIHYGQLHTILGARTKKHYTSIPHNLLPKYKVAHTGDLVMAITSEDVEGSCKSTAWLGNYDVIVGSDAAILHHEQDGTFLSYYTMTKAFYNEKAKYAKGFKVTHISTKEIEKISVFLPPLPLQHLFAQRIEQIEHQKSEVAKAITDLETLLASRMQHWFE